MAASGETTLSLRELRRRTARTLLGLHKQANVGHLGASLSCLEILLDVLVRRAGPEDLLVLSKGHAASALYTSLAATGRLDPRLLPTFCQEGTILAAHPPCGRQLPDAIPFGTGSLGHGLSLATGLAFSQRYTRRDFKVFAVLSDGDCDEGSTWEAALFAAQHGLDRLTVIVDRNHLQGFGSSEDVLALEPLADKWRAFGFEVAVAANGNDFDSLEEAHQKLTAFGLPRCIVAETIKGHGVSFMQNKLEWHYLPMSDAQYAQALVDTDSDA